MKKNILLLGLVVLSIVMCAGAVSAYGSYTGTGSGYNYYTYPVYGVSPYNIRIGGTFGTGAAYVYGLRPGTYYGKPCPQLVPSFYYSPTSCSSGSGYGSNYGYGSYSGYGSGGWGSAILTPHYNYGSNYGGYYGQNSVPYVYSGGL